MAIAGSSKAKTIANTVVPNTFTAAAAWDVKNNHALKRRDQNGYINGYYDDEAWWALAWLEAYDLTKKTDYLNTAEILFQDMTTGWGTNCSTGGLWWDKDHREIASISNTLFIEMAAWLATRVSSDKKSTYVNWAVKAWDWFRVSIMYEADKHFIVGDIDPKTCGLPNNPNAFTYAHGALVAGLLELSRATGNSSYLDEAHGVAARVISDMTTKAGVLEEPRIDQAHPGGAAPQFKGIFMRALARLHEASPRDAYVALAQRSADSIWANDRNGTALGPDWSGPFYGDANASPHSSAMDALVAAWRVTK
jgi:predicted alpha-1,6-mannanase (GH76 family)